MDRKTKLWNFSLWLLDGVMRLVTAAAFLAVLIGGSGLDAPDPTVAYAMAIGGLIVGALCALYWREIGVWEE